MPEARLGPLPTKGGVSWSKAAAQSELPARWAARLGLSSEVVFMRVSGSQSTKIFLPALLAMATLTLQAQQTTPQTTPSGAPTSTSAPGSSPTTPPTMPTGQTPTNPQSTPTATPASTAPNAVPCDAGNDNGKKKDKKDKKKGKEDQDVACQPTAEEMAAAQDTAIRARKNTAPEPGPNGVMPGVKQGSIDDVSAVGTRDIGGRGLGNWYSTETEMKEGKGVSMELE